MRVNEKTEKPNQEISAKGRILGLLRGDPETFFSGEILASRLGVSRVAIWKAIKSLQTMGYPVLSGERGYCWNREKTAPLYNDFLYPWEFGEKELFFHHLPITDSTMNRAAELAARGCPGGTVVSAGEQTAGRGRNGRPWVSQKGGLFFTLLERTNLCAADYFRISLAAQIAAARSLKRLCGIEAKLRWPNDLYAEGRKIAGFLTEFHAEGDKLLWISLGMGVNVNNVPYSKQSVNCANLAGRTISRQEVLVAILDEWELVKKDLHTSTIHREWNALAMDIGKKANAVENNNIKMSGTFLGIDARGRGIFSTDNQKRSFFNPGTISFQFKET